MCGRTMRKDFQGEGGSNGSARINKMGSDAIRFASAIGRVRTRQKPGAVSRPFHDRRWANQCQPMGGRNRSHEGDGAELGASVQYGGSSSVALPAQRRAPPFFSQQQVEAIIATVKQSEPTEHELPGHGWSLKKVRRWVKQVFGCEVSRSTLRILLKQKGLSWKKCQKLLKKASPVKRAAFVEEFQQLFAQLCQGKLRLIYIDESHFHRDLELGYTWATTGEPAWRASDCPSLSERINWYGAYDFSQGQCLIWNEGNCNQENTVKFLHHLAAWLGPSSIPVVIIWDGAPCHRAESVQAAAAALSFTLVPLPGYSPDLNPIEGLWKWMREEVTQHHCHPTLRHLFDACKAFIQRINAYPEQLIVRLWPKFQLDPDFEKLLVSN